MGGRGSVGGGAGEGGEKVEPGLPGVAVVGGASWIVGGDVWEAVDESSRKPRTW